jgi:phage replication O-like protein O
MPNKNTTATFQGFFAPNYTQVPDELFDDLMTDLSGAELKVLLYIIRRTFGFKKTEDTISLNQMLNGITTKAGEVLDRGTGLSKKTLLMALNTLEAKNIILTDAGEARNEGTNPQHISSI